MSTTLSSEKTSLASPKTANTRLAFLDGLRAIAALWVVVSHLWISQFGIVAHRGPMGLGTNWLLYSHLSVDAFIVLSGFCLILPVLKNDALKGGAWSFFARRARRILPPCYLALGLSITLALIFEHSDHGDWKIDQWSVLVNLVLLQDVALKSNIFNSPLWSVAVEWRIYFLFPMLVWALGRWGHRAVLIGAAVLGYSVTALIFWKFPNMLMASPWYLFLFALGICAGSIVFGKEAQRFDNVPWSLVSGTFLVILSLLLFTYPVVLNDGHVFGSHMPVIDAAAGAFIATLLIGISNHQKERRLTKALRLLSWSPLVALGQFSYSLYLTHMPMILTCDRLLRHNAFHTTALQNFALLLCPGLPMMLGFAYLFFLMIERPYMSKRPL